MASRQTRCQQILVQSVPPIKIHDDHVQRALVQPGPTNRFEQEQMQVPNVPKDLTPFFRSSLTAGVGNLFTRCHSSNVLLSIHLFHRPVLDWFVLLNCAVVCIRDSYRCRPLLLWCGCQQGVRT